MELDFESLKQEAIDAIERNKTMVLATCSDNKVTARTMSCVSNDLKIFFQTGDDTIKFKQMKENPNIALCCSNMTIEGIARFLNHPLKEKDFIERYKKEHHGSYNLYSFLRSEIVIEVEPKKITFWKYLNGKPCRDFLDLYTHTATREIFDTSDRIILD
jgi:hypothetical protein